MVHNYTTRHVKRSLRQVIVPDDVEEVVGPDVGPDDVERLLAIHTRLEQLWDDEYKKAQYEGDEEAAAFYLEKSVEIGQKIYQLILYMRQQRWWLWRDE
ncbi:10140_t:CDS:2 [Gigaspora rosea]|nr:10140_t:CDS:2 [Gigaspora rosea]